MGRALLILGWLATAALLGTAWAGWAVTDARTFEAHFLLGLGAALLLLFSHCWIMFYLIGTGKAVKEAVARHGLDAGLVERTKDLKNRSYPVLMLAIGLAMATFIVGGGVVTRVIPGWIHHGLFWATLIVQLRAVWREGEVLGENARLMAEVDRRAREAAH